MTKVEIKDCHFVSTDETTFHVRVTPERVEKLTMNGLFVVPKNKLSDLFALEWETRLLKW